MCTSLCNLCITASWVWPNLIWAPSDVVDSPCVAPGGVVPHSGRATVGRPRRWDATVPWLLPRRAEPLGTPAAKQLRALKPLEPLSPCAGVMGWKGMVVVLLELRPPWQQKSLLQKWLLQGKLHPKLWKNLLEIHGFPWILFLPATLEFGIFLQTSKAMLHSWHLPVLPRRSLRPNWQLHWSWVWAGAWVTRRGTEAIEWKSPL